jgi:hypothetical protein
MPYLFIYLSIAFAVISTHRTALGPRGPFSLCVFLHEESLCPSSGDINALMKISFINMEQ